MVMHLQLGLQVGQDPTRAGIIAMGRAQYNAIAEAVDRVRTQGETAFAQAGPAMLIVVTVTPPTLRLPLLRLALRCCSVIACAYGYDVKAMGSAVEMLPLPTLIYGARVRVRVRRSLRVRVRATVRDRDSDRDGDSARHRDTDRDRDRDGIVIAIATAIAIAIGMGIGIGIGIGIGMG